MYELRFDEDAIRVYKKAEVNLARRFNRWNEENTQITVQTTFNWLRLQMKT